MHRNNTIPGFMSPFINPGISFCPTPTPYTAVVPMPLVSDAVHGVVHGVAPARCSFLEPNQM